MTTLSVTLTDRFYVFDTRWSPFGVMKGSTLSFTIKWGRRIGGSAQCWGISVDPKRVWTVEGGDRHGYRADIIKGDRPLHMLELEFDT